MDLLLEGSLTGIIALSEASKEACGRCRIDNPAVLLFSEMWPCCPRALWNIVSFVGQCNEFPDSAYFICTLDMDFNDQIPVVVGHILEADISQNAGIVEENIDSSELPNSGINDFFAVLHAVVVCDCFASSCLDFINDYIGGLQHID